MVLNVLNSNDLDTMMKDNHHNTDRMIYLKLLHDVPSMFLCHNFLIDNRFLAQMEVVGHIDHEKHMMKEKLMVMMLEWLMPFDMDPNGR